MRRCRTKKNKKWRVQLIQQRPRPAHSRTGCLLWRSWTPSSTHGPSVNTVALICRSHSPSVFHPTVLFDVTLTRLSLCAFCCAPQWSGPDYRRTEQSRACEAVQRILSGTVKHAALLCAAGLQSLPENMNKYMRTVSEGGHASAPLDLLDVNAPS